MTHITRAYRLGELHHFEADSHRFVYLVSAGAIFELDGAAERLVNRLRDGAASHDELMAEVPSYRTLIEAFEHDREAMERDREVGSQ